jgi:Flp pilus assembly secretin CpaC
MRRLLQRFSLVLLALCAGTAAAGPLDVPILTGTIVGVGRHVIVSIPSGAQVVAAGDQHLATAQSLSDTELLVTGIARGQTTVRLRDAEGTETSWQILVDATSPVATENPAQLISIGVGHQKSLFLTDVKRIAVGDPKVADAMVVGGREILLTGMAAGRTSLIIWRNNEARVSYVLKIEDKPLEESAAEIRQLLGPMEGVRLRLVGDHIYLDGDVETKEDLELVKRVCGLYQPVLVCL